MGSLLNSAEQKFFDNVALEVLTLAGTPSPILYKFSKTGYATASNITSVSGLIDCLYEEPRIPTRLPSGSKLQRYTPYQVLCYFERPTHVIDAQDNGLVERTEGKFWFSRLDLENKKVPLNEHGYHVQPGDVIELWSKITNKYWYFDIITAERDGFEHDSEVWTHYECEAVRNESFSPERKIGT
jgi:hypothetical protein